MISKSHEFSENFHKVRIKSTVTMKTLLTSTTQTTTLSTTTLSSKSSAIEDLVQTLNNYNFILLILIIKQI